MPHKYREKKKLLKKEWYALYDKWSETIEKFEKIQLHPWQLVIFYQKLIVTPEGAGWLDFGPEHDWEGLWVMYPYPKIQREVEKVL